MIRKKDLIEGDIFILDADGFQVLGEFSHYDNDNEDKFWALRSVDTNLRFLKTETDWLLCGFGRGLYKATAKDKRKFWDLYAQALSISYEMDFTIAKLAEERGYDEYSSFYYVQAKEDLTKRDGLGRDVKKGFIEKVDDGTTMSKNSYWKVTNRGNSKLYYCTGVDYFKLDLWLRKEHGIDIILTKDVRIPGHGYYQVDIFCGDKPISNNDMSSNIDFNPERLYKNALIKALKLIQYDGNRILVEKDR